MIYFDNAATTLKKPEVVIQAVVNAMQTMGNSSRGSHDGCLSASRVVFQARDKIDQFFHGYGSDHVIFTQNSTEALNMVIRGGIPEKSHVISTDLEHNSVLRPLYQLEKEGKIELDFLKADRDGNIDYAELEQLIRPTTRAIVCTHASNLTGLIVDIKSIGEVAKAHNLFFVVDASQTAGVVPIDMQAMHIDALCFTGHKGLFGPQGTGGACISDRINIKPWKIGGTGVQSYLKEQPEELPIRLEAGTLNGHGIAGLLAAISYIEEIGLDEIGRKEEKLMKRFYQGVSQCPEITIYGDFSKERVAIVTINIKDIDSSRISDILSFDYGIATRPGAHCAPRLHEALGTIEQGAVRFSFSYFNTEEEVDEALQALKEIIEMEGE